MCCVRDDGEVLLVLWYDEVHMGEELDCPRWPPSDLASTVAMCQIRSTTRQESSLHTTFTKVVLAMMPAVGSKVEEMGLFTKSVGTNVSSAS